MPPQTEILSLLDDCTRMTWEFFPTISIACLQLHQHIIPFLPIECRLSQVYGARSDSSIDVFMGRKRAWGACGRVLEGHTDTCTCIAFSLDGGRLVSGSRDCSVRLWSVQTGALLQ